jgi:hypothetical protein
MLHYFGFFAWKERCTMSNSCIPNASALLREVGQAYSRRVAHSSGAAPDLDPIGAASRSWENDRLQGMSRIALCLSSALERLGGSLRRQRKQRVKGRGGAPSVAGTEVLSKASLVLGLIVRLHEQADILAQGGTPRDYPPHVRPLHDALGSSVIARCDPALQSLQAFMSAHQIRQIRWGELGDIGAWVEAR